MSVILTLIPNWETHSLVLDVPPGALAAVVVKNRIHAATFSAQKYGVKVGMKLDLAKQICPDLLVMAMDESRSQRAFKVILEALDSVSAFVQGIRPGLAMLRPPQELKEKEKEEFLESIVDAVAWHTQAEAYVGWGNNLLEAWGEVLSFLPEAVHEYGNIKSVTDLPVGALAELFSAEAVPEQNMLTELQQLGVIKLKQLQQLGWAALNSRFGMAAQNLRNLVEFGVGQKMTVPKDTEISVVLKLDEPAQNPLLIVGQLVRQVEEIIQRMQGRQVSAQNLLIEALIQIPEISSSNGFLGSTGEEIVSRGRNWALFEFPTVLDLTTRLQWQLQVWLEDLSSRCILLKNEPSAANQTDLGIVEIRLTATDLIPISLVTQKLWGNKTAAEIRALTVAMKIQTRLGAGNVQQVRVVPGWDPISKVEYRELGAKNYSPAVGKTQYPRETSAES